MYINKSTKSPILCRLLEKYGELLSLEEIAEIFKYKTIGVVRKAHSRGVLPVVLYRFSNKSGFYAKENKVAESIERMEMSKPVQSSSTNT